MSIRELKSKLLEDILEMSKNKAQRRDDMLVCIGMLLGLDKLVEQQMPEPWEMWWDRGCRRIQIRPILESDAAPLFN